MIFRGKDIVTIEAYFHPDIGYTQYVIKLDNGESGEFALSELPPNVKRFIATKPCTYTLWDVNELLKNSWPNIP